MPKDIKNADAKLLRKALKDVVDKYDNKKGTHKRMQLQEYDDVLRAAIKKIADLTA